MYGAGVEIIDTHGAWIAKVSNAVVDQPSWKAGVSSFLVD